MQEEGKGREEVKRMVTCSLKSSVPIMLTNIRCWYARMKKSHLTKGNAPSLPPKCNTHTTIAELHDTFHKETRPTEIVNGTFSWK
jgi:hypothetical protein